MNYRENVQAILETCFAGYKDELIESATNRICSIKVKSHDSVLGKISAEIESRCDRINTLVTSELSYPVCREVQELLCEIINLCKAESEV